MSSGNNRLKYLITITCFDDVSFSCTTSNFPSNTIKNLGLCGVDGKYWVCNEFIGLASDTPKILYGSNIQPGTIENL
jgi:hypothetical protein